MDRGKMGIFGKPMKQKVEQHDTQLGHTDAHREQLRNLNLEPFNSPAANKMQISLPECETSLHSSNTDVTVNEYPNAALLEGINRSTDAENNIGEITGRRDSMSSEELEIDLDHSGILPGNGEDNESEAPSESVNLEQHQITDNGNKREGELRFMYTNADSLLGKRDLLKLKIEEYQPDVILISELLPKNKTRLDLNVEHEFHIEGYQLYLGKHLKRGVAIYVQSSLCSSKEEVLSEDELEEQVWCTISIRNSTKLLVGCVYYSPNSTAENHTRVINCIGKGCRAGYSNILIAGDFNRPKIDWENYNASSEQDLQFLKALQDNFLTQLVNGTTRHRDGQRATVDDLVLTTCEEIVNDVREGDPIGKSDHVCLYFDVTASPPSGTTSSPRYNMNKIDAELLKSKFASVEWEQEGKATSDLWDFFCRTYDSVVESCVPKCKTSSPFRQKPMWMDRDATQLTKKKLRTWKR